MFMRVSNDDVIMTSSSLDDLDDDVMTSCMHLFCEFVVFRFGTILFGEEEEVENPQSQHHLNYHMVGGCLVCVCVCVCVCVEISVLDVGMHIMVSSLRLRSLG